MGSVIGLPLMVLLSVLFYSLLQGWFLTLDKTEHLPHPQAIPQTLHFDPVPQADSTKYCLPAALTSKPYAWPGLGQPAMSLRWF